MQNGKENKSLLFLTNGVNYGAFETVNNINNEPNPMGTSMGSKKIVYCVHGKPSAGCCKVLESEIIEITGNDEFSSSAVPPQARENSLATNLVNKHCHQSKSPEVDNIARTKLITASILCVIFMIGEVIGGYISNSLAIASDAAHLLTDFASFMISLFSIWMANRPSTKKMSFGWYRAEVIGALTSVLLIWVVTGVLVYLGIERILNQSFDIDAKVMLITSGIGVIINLIMGLTLHQHGHSHSGSHDDHIHNANSKNNSNKTKKKHSGGTNINVRAAFIHVIGDFLQSFGVFVAALVIYFKNEWVIIDPICTFLFSVLVLFTTYAIIRDALMVLMEASPKGIEFNEVMTVLLKIDGVKRVHNLRIWALSLDKITMSAHVAINPGVNPQHILMLATKNVHEKYNFFEMTLQIEEFQEVMENCNMCKNPQ